MSEGHGQDEEEVARLWLADGTLHYSVAPDVFEEPATWGEVLADMANFAAESLAEGDHDKKQRLLDEMKQAFLDGLSAGPGE
jgi:hypothetical protein